MDHFVVVVVLYLFLCYILGFFGREACGILVPRSGIEPTPPALKGNVLTTGPPGKSLTVLSTFAFKL